MKSISPTIPGHKTTVLHGEGCEDLPAYLYEHPPGQNIAYTRWRLSFGERFRVATRGEIGLYQWIGRSHLQPMIIETRRPFKTPVDWPSWVGCLFMLSLFWDCWQTGRSAWVDSWLPSVALAQIFVVLLCVLWPDDTRLFIGRLCGFEKFPARSKGGSGEKPIETPGDMDRWLP
jgi:hypothetical protein